MAKTVDELYKIVYDQQKEIDRLKKKLLNAQAHCYELLSKGELPHEVHTDTDLKAQNYYLTMELKKVIEQRDRFKSQVVTH